MTEDPSLDLPLGRAPPALLPSYFMPGFMHCLPMSILSYLKQVTGVLVPYQSNICHYLPFNAYNILVQPKKKCFNVVMKRLSIIIGKSIEIVF